MKIYWIAIFSWLLASAGCDAGTGGALVEIDLTFATEPQEGHAVGVFKTTTGYLVELSEAKVAVASILTYAPQGQTMSLSRLWLSKAHAHGGFDPFNGRRVRAEYNSDDGTILDLLAAERTLGVVQAEAGAIDSSTVMFADTLEGRAAQAFVRGKAARDGESFEFEGALALEDQALLRRVDGIPAHGEITAGGKLTIVFRPHVWFEEAHFERLGENADGPRQITAASQVHTAWSFGARSAKAYETRWSEP